MIFKKNELKFVTFFIFYYFVYNDNLEWSKWISKIEYHKSLYFPFHIAYLLSLLALSAFKSLNTKAS